MNTNHQTLTALAEAIDPVCLVRNAVEFIITVDKMWGNARLGLVLTDAFFRKQPVTTDELSLKCDASTETVRRLLRPLINVGRVRVLKEGRNIRYKAKAEWARWTSAALLTAIKNCIDEHG